MREYDFVKEKLDRAIQNDPSHISSLKLYGDFEKKTGNLEVAVTYYKKAVENNNQFHIAHYALGRAYYELQNNEEAITALNNAVIADPTYAKAYELRGIIFQSLNNLSEAVQNFELAVANNTKAYVANFRIQIWARYCCTRSRTDWTRLVASFESPWCLKNHFERSDRVEISAGEKIWG